MKYTLGIVALAVTISLVGLGVLLFATPQNISDPSGTGVGRIDQQQSYPKPSIGHPPPLKLSDMGLVSFEETGRKMAEQKANFTLKIPTSMPQGYRVIGVYLGPLGAVASDPVSKSSFRTQHAEVWIWNKDMTSNTTNMEVLSTGGIFLDITHAPGHNSTELYSSFNNPPKSVVKYFLGYPAVITYGDPNIKGTPEGINQIILYHSGRQVQYRMSSSLPVDTMLKMMESIVKNP